MIITTVAQKRMDHWISRFHVNSFLLRKKPDPDPDVFSSFKGAWDLGISKPPILVGPYDLLDKGMTDDVPFIEINKTDPLDFLEYIQNLDQA